MTLNQLRIKQFGAGRAMRLSCMLLCWYSRARRDLPWRRTRDPYRIWLSEVMLQQTRVAAVIPYYERFLERFPDVAALAAATESDLLAAWSGLGYYSRARNMQKAARQIVTAGGFPRQIDKIRELPGVGEYTAAAVASIAFDQPYAAVDGNVLRVLSRLSNEDGDIGSNGARRRLADLAQRLVAGGQPGETNQALMELGATVCVPRKPKCEQCPWRRLCDGRKAGRQEQLPTKRKPKRAHSVERTFLVVRRNRKVLLWRRPPGSKRLSGFWELPEPAQAPTATVIREAGTFRHSITNRNYLCHVLVAAVRQTPEGLSWLPEEALKTTPLSTTVCKALRLLGEQGLFQHVNSR